MLSSALMRARIAAIYDHDEGFEILETAFPGRAEETYVRSCQRMP